MLAIRFEPRAAAEVDRIDRWWRENRPASPDLFARELEEAARLVASVPTSGSSPDEGLRLVGVRRALMRRSRYHLYYRVDDDALIVVAVWHTSRGRGPALR